MPKLVDILWIIPLLPLAGAAINGLFGKSWPNSRVNAVGIGSVSLTFLAVLELVREFFLLPAAQIPIIKSVGPWIVAGNFRADFNFWVDQLTIVMLLVVSGVGLLIHIYSTGYMAHEGGYYRFFCYFNLFMFFMLTLVMAGNLVLMFVGWEGVGLCSYLLIGFWFLRKSAIDAGKKAFITTRIGDVGFTVGILLAFWTFSSVDFGTIFLKVANAPVEGVGQIGVLTTIALLLFAGAIGKSAQLPLYVWLPDAMEGPTPVSALIHAATMVTAGVYMVARMHLLYSHALTAMLVVASVGAITAFYSATIGLVQTDIKKVLAYSTVSQLGYMFLGCGVGAYAAGVFHLMTHAFFKGLLFLAAGSVIHAMGGEQDMRKMGGLRKQIPVTYWTMFAATLAIAGVPLFSGFFSKEAILDAAKDGPLANMPLWVLGILGAMLTSFYMFRLLFLTFFGKPRYDEHKVHVHESPRNMLVPLIILALLAVGGGWFALPTMIGGPDHFQNFLRPVFEAAPAAAAATTEGAKEASVTPGSALVSSLFAPGVIVALIGFLTAWWFYIRRPDVPKKLAQSVHGLYTLLLNKYYVDEIYLAVIIRPLLWISTNILWHVVDEGLIDGAVNGAGHTARGIGQQARKLQSGNARSYAAWVVIGAVCVTVLVLGVWGMVR
ncbi:MAG: NADH-quinone oxidoreductase subunit L [Candidatus Acidiferrales bacterium]